VEAKVVRRVLVVTICTDPLSIKRKELPISFLGNATIWAANLYLMGDVAGHLSSSLYSAGLLGTKLADRQ
jgi:hypothetical protein